LLAFRPRPLAGHVGLVLLSDPRTHRRRRPMSVLVTKEAPDFTATALMPDGSFKNDFKLSDFRGKKVALFFYPLDFTFVCPSELIAFHNKTNEFKKRDCQVIGCSIDSHFTHLAWSNTPVEQGGIGKVSYPLVADL